ncbi:unnamed protein product [Trichogramma brassicae]|uniref:Essential protein Yae1 N-terminal domain-containing protein n=1 Tax=Trichogramma brassicae TaxID=86971 RepID=A0A6H5I515_9HYME|nr:unnamed protein product [Trichogramma brassicae]
MCDINVSPDVNDVFSDLLMSENLAEDQAYEKGYEVGKNQMVDGYHLGYHGASSAAAELGYYYGVLIFIRKNCNNSKVIESTNILMKRLENFPTDNNESVDIGTELETIGLNFKKICSLAKVDSRYPETNKTEF